MVRRGGGIFEQDLKHQFNQNGIRFDGKRCLDIGTRDGLNCITLVDLGASEVIGIDIDSSRFNEHISNPRFNELLTNETIKLKNEDLLKFQDENKFDVITCFLWNMRFKDYDEIMKKIKSLLKQGGVVYIGAHDSSYTIEINETSVIKLLRKYFYNVNILRYFNPYSNNNSLNNKIDKKTGRYLGQIQVIFQAKNPKPLQE